MVKNYVKTNVDVIGYHRYQNAPDDVSYLRNWHRHHFIVTVKICVTNLDREIEFFELQQKVLSYLMETYLTKADWGTCLVFASCEMVANDVLGQLLKWFGKRQMSVDVSEDGESSGGAEYDCVDGN